MSDKEKEFTKKINIDKAKNKTALPILLMFLSLFTYIIYGIYGEFDFGIVFEIISLIFLLVARYHMYKYNENRAKRYIICSIGSIGWILIYDTIFFCASIQDIISLALLSYVYFFSEIFSIVYLIILFSINRDLSKAYNPTKYKESTDWFYEKYENNEKGANNERIRRTNK